MNPMNDMRGMVGNPQFMHFNMMMQQMMDANNQMQGGSFNNRGGYGGGRGGRGGYNNDRNSSSNYGGGSDYNQGGYNNNRGGYNSGQNFNNNSNNFNNQGGQQSQAGFGGNQQNQAAMGGQAGFNNFGGFNNPMMVAQTQNNAGMGQTGQAGQTGQTQPVGQALGVNMMAPGPTTVSPGNEIEWTLEMISANMAGFEAKSEDIKRNTMGKLMYNKISELNPTLDSTGSNMIAKVTAILIDNETFTIGEIVENLQSDIEMGKNVEEAITIINEQS